MSRKDELLKRLIHHKGLQDFVIIDDDTSLNDLPLNLKNRLIQMKPFIGLTESQLETLDIDANINEPA